MTAPPLHLRLQGFTPERLVAQLGADVISLGDARKVIAHCVQRGGDVREVEGVKKSLRARLAAEIPAGRLEVVSRQGSREDPFVKFLLRSEDGAEFETVRIPLERSGRFSVCVSSQVGCAMGCGFCATARMGLTRGLHAWEIVAQVQVVAQELRRTGEGRVHGVVFQGMGEPLHNLDGVLPALEAISDPCGLAVDGRNVTVCTVGIIPGIDRLREHPTRARLAISVTSARATLRRSLIPMEGKYPIAEVIEAAQRYREKKGYLVMLAYVLLGGVNTTDDEAEALKELLARMPARLSLIDWNPVEGIDLRPPTEAERSRFHDQLAKLGVPVVRRYSGGKDIDAACGQLATRSGRRGRGRGAETAEPPVTSR
ncbi:MAG: 23S rRNA (adenine(2503)-C(2))-methyltransferase RlmN [Polyangiales bacterium]